MNEQDEEGVMVWALAGLAAIIGTPVALWGWYMLGNGLLRLWQLWF